MPPEPRRMKTIMVCGSRQWRDRSCVHLVLLCEPKYQGWDGERIKIIHGDCRGADKLAGEVADELGYDVERFPADWNTHGKSAGPIRNAEMLGVPPDLVVAFGRGRGTDGAVTQARRRGIPVRRF